MADKTYEELLDLSAVAPEPSPLDRSLVTSEKQRAAQAEQKLKTEEETTLLDAVSVGFQQNTGPMMWDALQRKVSNEPEEGFDPNEFIKANEHRIDSALHEEFGGVRSTAEAEELISDIARQTKNTQIIEAHGATGAAAAMLAGIVDVDTLIPGIGFAKTGVKLTARAIGRGGAEGAALGAGVEVSRGAVDPLSDTQDVVTGALVGSVLGGAGHGAAAYKANRAKDQVMEQHKQALADLPRADEVRVEAGAGMAPEAEPDFVPYTGPSVGAGTTKTTIDWTQLNPEQTAVVDAAQRSLDLGGGRHVDVELDNPQDNFPDTALGRTAAKFATALRDGEYTTSIMGKEFTVKTPDVVKTDYDRLATDGGAVELSLAYNLLENAEGILVNNRSAANLQEVYHQRIASHSMQQLTDSFDGWAAGRNMSTWQKHHPNARVEFDRELMAEMEARYHGDLALSQDASIKAAADALDQNMADALSVAKGRAGETSMFGWNDIKQKSGFMPRTWQGDAIRRKMANGTSQARIEALIARETHKQSPNLSPEDTALIAKAIVRRALNKAEGVDANMLSTLDQDGVAILTDVLSDAGVPQKDIDDLVTRMRGKQDEQGMDKSAKHRVKLDLRASDGDLSLMDLVDTNVTRTVSRYNRRISGGAALARKGITGAADKKKLIDAAMAERRARGLTVDASKREFLENVFTHFDAGPIAGGVSPWVARAKRITNLGILNQMGLTQLYESGAQVAAVGVYLWGKHAALTMKTLKKGGPDSPLLKELKPIMGNVGQEHILFRDDLMMDELHKTASGAADIDGFVSGLDYALGKGQRLQGYMSGFYAVRSFQQKMAVTSMADKVMQRLRDDVDGDELAKIGLPKNLKKYINNGMVEFLPDGTLDKLNLAKWKPADAEELALALNRHTNVVVQKAMAGEDSIWMHKDVGAMLSHLKAFPLLAMRKQSIRHAGTGDQVFMAQLLLGLATAAMFSTAKQVINGRTENITPIDVVKNTVQMSNMTGWLPMFTDPAAAVLGLDDLRVGKFGRTNVQEGVIPMPPTLPILTKMLRIPGALNPFGDLTANERIRIMQTTPIVGNYYGFTALFNAMKD